MTFLDIISDSNITFVLILAAIVTLGIYIIVASKGNPMALLHDEDLRKKVPMAAAAMVGIVLLLSIVSSSARRSMRDRKVNKAVDDYNKTREESEKRIGEIKDEEREVRSEVDLNLADGARADAAADKKIEEANEARNRADKHHDDFEDALARANRLRDERVEKEGS